MKLRISRSTRNKIVTLELETVAFTDKENRMLDQLGEPVIEIDKTYGNHPVKFSKKIRTNFRLRIRFDGNLDLNTDITGDLINEFQEELETKLSDAMTNLLNNYSDDFNTKEEVIEIKY